MRSAEIRPEENNSVVLKPPYHDFPLLLLGAKGIANI